MIEPIWWLRALPYSDYRATNHWRSRRERFIESVVAMDGCKRCSVCGLADDDFGFRISFHVHHRTYEHLGYEPDTDLALLCAPCHNVVHRPDSHAAQHWIAYWRIEDIDVASVAQEFRPQENIQ